jgi:uncharacterized delta-60 repeat protein
MNATPIKSSSGAFIRSAGGVRGVRGGFDNNVRGITIDANDKAYCGGQFTSYGGTTRQRIARLRAKCVLDTAFDSISGFNDIVYAVAIDSDGKIYCGGDFTSYDGTTCERIARLNTDGTIDTAFDSSSGFNNVVRTIAIDSNDKPICGGEFTSYDGTTRQRIARLNTDGTLDTAFDSSSGFNGVIFELAIDSNDKPICGGNYTTYGGTTRQRIARLNTNGTLDTAFDSSSGFNNTVIAVKLDASGKIYCGGVFISYGGTTCERIARLNTDGTIDTAFDSSSGFNDWVWSLAIDSNDKPICGGQFTSYDGTACERIARLNTDGTLDTAFDSSSGFNGIVYAIGIVTDGKLYCGGNFTSYGGIKRLRITRLNADGSLN